MTDKTQALASSDDLALAALNQSQPQIAAEADELAKSNQVAQTLSALQNLIERNANLLDEVKEKLKKYRESLKNIFDNDTQLSAAQDQVNTFSQQLKDRRSKLAADPAVINFRNNIAQLTEQKKELEETLSDHLLNYYQLTNSKSFDTSDGDQREFEIKAMVRAKKK